MAEGAESESPDVRDDLEPFDEFAIVMSELPCGGGVYDHEQTVAAIEFLAGLVGGVRSLEFPHDWALDPDSPLSAEWHIPVVNRMAAQRVVDQPDHATYLKRLAILVWSVYKTAPWPERIRKGTAWALLRYGLYMHNFVAYDNPAKARVIVSPDRDFFEQFVQDADSLARMLSDIYKYKFRDDL